MALWHHNILDLGDKSENIDKCAVKSHFNYKWIILCNAAVGIA